MSKFTLTRLAVQLLPAAVLTLAGEAATAQQLEGVTVEGLRIVTVGRNQVGGPSQQVILRRGASYKDLDLSTPAGAQELHKRIEQVAASLCAELDKLYPLDEPQARECTRVAVKGASAEADKLSAAPKTKAK